MRLSEKTIELNFCAQFLGSYSPFRMHPAWHDMRIVWFGLTQKQEAQAGFDACTKIGGHLMIFQFKASNNVLKNGNRRFSAKHEQMEKLRQRCRGIERSVFYVFPDIGTTHELTLTPEIFSRTWLLDVANIPMLDEPKKKDGQPRASGSHYVDIDPPNARAIIRSEPKEVSLIKASEFLDADYYFIRSGRRFIGEVAKDDPMLKSLYGESFTKFWEFRQLLERQSVAVIIADVP